MTQPAVVDETEKQLITEAVNRHGIFFKRAVRQALEKIEGVEILGEEYPITYLEGGAIDLLVACTKPLWGNHFILPIECKRGYAANKRWIFFESPETEAKLFYSFQREFLRPIALDPSFFNQTMVCVEGIQVELNTSKGTDSAKANPTAIWEAANQTCKGALGFLNQELQTRQRIHAQSKWQSVKDFRMCPVIITSAPLSVCSLSSQTVDLATGNHLGNMQHTPVDKLILLHPFTPSPEDGAVYSREETPPYASHAKRSYDLKEGIFVVSSTKLPEFVNALYNLT